MHEGSRKDRREDAKHAKARGMTAEQWERSAADKAHDAGKPVPKPRKRVPQRDGLAKFARGIRAI